MADSGHIVSAARHAGVDLESFQWARLLHGPVGDQSYGQKIRGDGGEDIVQVGLRVAR